MGLDALWHTAYSKTRDLTCVSCIGWQILTHCPTREPQTNSSISSVIRVLMLNMYALMGCSTCIRTHLEIPLFPQSLGGHEGFHTNSIYSPGHSPTEPSLIPFKSVLNPSSHHLGSAKRGWWLFLIALMNAVSSDGNHLTPLSPFPQKSRERNRLTVGSRGSSPELTGPTN